MELVFEIVIDFIVTIFIDNTDNIIKNKKISKWIRYPVLIFVLLLTILFTLVPIILGIILLSKNIIASIIFIIIGTLFSICVIIEVRKVIAEKNKK